MFLIVQETDRKHKSNLDKITKLEQNLKKIVRLCLLNNCLKYISPHKCFSMRYFTTYQNLKLNSDKIKKLVQNLNIEKKIVRFFRF